MSKCMLHASHFVSLGFCNRFICHFFQVSFIDSWLLCRNPIKRFLLRIMRKSSADANNELQKQIVYSFGDHYYFRKELKILNLLTGYESFSVHNLCLFQLEAVIFTICLLLLLACRYIFLLDKFGRIRWQGFGLATKEELSSLLSCTSLLLEEK